jgi:hypothetical protein
MNPSEEPEICQHCSEDPCTKSYLQCMQDAKDEYDDHRWHEMREERL